MIHSDENKPKKTPVLVYAAIGVGLVIGLVMKKIAVGLIVGFIGAAVVNFVAGRRDK